MKNKFVWQMMESLRGFPLSTADSIELVLMVLAWAKVSADRDLPEQLRFEAGIVTEPRRALSALAELGTMDPELRVFAGISRLTRNDPTILRPALEVALQLKNMGLLQGFDADDAVDALQQLAPPEMGVPEEVGAVLVQLAGIQQSDTVYVAWDYAAQIALNAAKAGEKVYLEARTHSHIPDLISLLAKKPFETHDGNPITSPSAVKDGKLLGFDVAIAMLPFGLKFDSEVTAQDWFGRFPELTTSGAVLGVRQLLSQATRRVVVGVQNSLLFSTGTELALRRDLIEKGMVVAVIAMPGGLMASTNLPFSILVLDPAGGHDEIRFVSAESSHFRKAVSKAKSQLVQIDDLVRLATAEAVSDFAATIKTADVFAKDSQLQVSRYVLPEEQKRIQGLVANAKTVALGDVVNTIRPMMTNPYADNSIEAFEIGAANLPGHGYICQPGKPVVIERQIAEKSNSQFLRPLDVVLIVKGSIGKVGIIPENVPPPGAGGWVAGQSAIVLRCPPDGAMDPRALAMQLRSSFGQKILNSINSASTIPLIQLRELLRLQILVPDRSTADKAIDALTQEAALQRQIDLLHQQQSQVAETLWAL